MWEYCPFNIWSLITMQSRLIYPGCQRFFSLFGGQGVEQQSCQSELRSSEKACRPALCSLRFLQLVSEEAFGIQGRVSDFTIIYFVIYQMNNTYM